MERRQTTKRTTIIFDEKDRQYLEQLIKEGKEPGIKPLISKMFGAWPFTTGSSPANTTAVSVE